MIDIFIGEDTQSARKALRKELKNLTDETGFMGIQRFSDVSFEPLIANEALFAQNLFGGQSIIVFDGVLDSSEYKDFYTDEIKNSPNQVFIRETAPNKDILDILKKIGTLHEFPLKKAKPINNFVIADAVAARNKKVAWVELIRAKERGAAAEEIHGLIFWATKLLYLCQQCDKEEAIKAGVSSYNYQSYFGHSKKFLEPELASRLRELTEMYHRAHRGEGDFDAMLEQYILKV